MKKTFSPRSQFVALCLALVASCATAAPPPLTLTDPGQIQTEAYIQLQLGEESLDAGRLEEALKQFQAARDYYQQLAREFPGWEPRVIQYRTTYCLNQIAEVERRLAASISPQTPEAPPPPPPKTPATPPPPAATPAKPDRSAEIEYLKGRIAQLEAELEDVDSLHEQLEALGAENDKLRRELDSLRKKQAETAKSEQSAAEKLRAELAEKDRQLEALQQQLAAKKQLDQALNEREATLRDLRKQNERLDQEIKDLNQELDEMESRLEKAEARAKEAAANARQQEAKAKQAEKELRRAKDELAAMENKLSASQRRQPPEVPSSPKSITEMAPAPVEAPPQAKASPPPPPPPVPASPASAPPPPIPEGMTPADYIRRLLQEGNNETALAAVQTMRASVPQDINLALLEGIALIRLQRYPEAASLLIELVKNNPRHAELHATLGAAMMGAGVYDAARQELLLAVKLDRNISGEYYYNLAQLFALTEPVDLKQARRYYQQARNLGIPADPALEKMLK